MPVWRGWDKIKYQAQLDPAFAEEVASIPGGEKLFDCIQCGTCSGLCPLSPYMDFTPRKIIAMIRAGFKGEVLSSHTCWLCASCYACTVECPKGVKITEIMYATKRLAIREGVSPKRFAIPVLAEEFFKDVESNGRNSEGRLIMKLYLRTNLLKALKQTSLGLRLWSQGRIGIKADRIKRKGELQALLKSLEKEHMVRSPRDISRARGGK
ncbi:MAG: 4Fe-4S dicluster domain-containing protein [bacterium]|jgi:heterodisulfide reductase subunit C